MKSKKWLALGVCCALLACGMSQGSEAFSLGGLAKKAVNRVAKNKTNAVSVKKAAVAGAAAAALGAAAGDSSDAADADDAVGAVSVIGNMADGPRVAAPWDTGETVEPRTTGNGVYDIKEADGTKPTAWSTTPLDPLPPDETYERPDWVENRTSVFAMTNARLVAEYENLDAWRKRAKETGLGLVEPDMFRYDELGSEIVDRVEALNDYNDTEPARMDGYLISKGCFQRAVSSNIKALYKHGLKLRVPESRLPGYHPERDPGDTN